MQQDIERKILVFTEATGFTKRAEITHGTLFVEFKEEYGDMKEEFRQSLKDMMQNMVDPNTGVNGNEIGTEFAYDFVPVAHERPWNSTDTMESTVDTQVNLEAKEFFADARDHHLIHQDLTRAVGGKR
jgi:hypothetical protein